MEINKYNEYRKKYNRENYNKDKRHIIYLKNKDNEINKSKTYYQLHRDEILQKRKKEREEVKKIRNLLKTIKEN